MTDFTTATAASSASAPGKTLGVRGDTEHDKLVQDVMQSDKFYFDQLKPRFRNIVRWNRLYLADKDDIRSQDEKKWRANVFVPYPYSGVETKVAVLSDILNSADPPIQAEGVGDDDVESARKGQLLLDYQLRRSRWRKTLMKLLRTSAIEGTSFYKLHWINKQHSMTVYPDQSQADDFHKSILDARGAGAGEPPDYASDPAAFNVWRNLANSMGKQGVRVAEIPSGGKQIVTNYRGPFMDRISHFDLRYDPLIDEMTDQHRVIHRYVKNKRWLLDRCGPEPWKPFSEAAVAAIYGPNYDDAAMGNATALRLSEYDVEIANILGITPNDVMDPYYSDAVEIHEVWQPGDDFPYLVVLNQLAVINKHPDQLPFWHGDCAIGAIRNVQVPGYLPGISELQEPEALYYEMNSLRNLRLDGVTLSVLPVFQKLKAMGLPEFMRMIRPGSIIPVDRMDAIQQLVKPTVPSEAFREMTEIKDDIDFTNASFSNVRGASASVGRVSATENQQRFQQAVSRLKLSAVQVEEDLDTFVNQSLALWYQFGDSDLRVKIAGPGDPWLSLTKGEIFEAMGIDYRFRGATRALNKELQVQQMTTFGQQFAQAMLPNEIRALMKAIWDTMGLRGATTIITDAGTKTLTDQWNLQHQIATEQMQAQAAQAAAGQVQVPGSVTPEMAAHISGEAPGGGQGQAPPPAQGNGGAPPPPQAGG